MTLLIMIRVTTYLGSMTNLRNCDVRFEKIGVEGKVRLNGLDVNGRI